MQRLASATRQLIELHQAQAPVNVLGLAEDLDLNVWGDSLGDKSGKLFQDPEHGGASGYSIVVNEAEPSTRQRFTIAHEIAHFLLHRDQIGHAVEDDTFYRSSLSSTRETEANRLAADILMPYGLIRRLQERGITEVRDLAAALDVSQPALKIRLGVPVF
jgi:hypothetical protein